MNLLWKLLLFVWILSDAHGEPEKNPLRKATNELFTISRLVNGIAIQHEISSKTLKMDEFISEVLNVDPGKNGLSTLQKTDLSDVIEKMTEVSEEAKAIKTNSLNVASIENKLKTLGDLGSNLDSLKKINNTQLDNLKNTVELATKSQNSFFIFTAFKIVANELQKFLSSGGDLDNAYNYLKSNLRDFEITRKSIENYETNLENVWAMMKFTNEMKYLEALSQTSDQLQKKHADLLSLLNDLDGLKKEFSAVDKGLTNIKDMKHVAGILNSTRLFFESMKTNPLQNRYLTVGFPKGSSDMKLVFKEMKEDWLKRTVADNDESGWVTFIKELDDFKALSEKSESVSLSWKSLENITSLKELSATTNLWNIISENSLNSAEVQILQNSTALIKKCLTDLRPIPQSYDVNSFKVVFEKVRNLSTLATNSYKLFDQLASIEILQNDTLFKNLTDLILQTNTNNNSEVINTLHTIQNSEDYRKLIGAVKEASGIMEQIQIEDAFTILNFNGVDLNLTINMQEEFNKTHLIPSLECLEESKFDNSKIFETLKFGSDLRALGKHSTQDKTTAPFLKQMIHFKKNKPLTISKNLVKGVELVDNLANLQANEKLMNEVANSKKEVLEEMKQVLPSVDTSSFTSGFLKMIQDLKSLVSRVQSEKEVTLEKYEKLFGAASGIAGVPINSTLLIDPVSKTLSASNKSTESDSFRKLGGFELDYSAHQKELNTASLTVIKLKQYFDGLFSHPKESSHDVDIKELLSTYGKYAGSAVVAALIAVGGHFAFRRWQYRKMQKDPNSYLYLIQAIPEERNLYGKSYWNSLDSEFLPIHTSILNDNGDYKEFKKQIDKGANVNAYSLCSQDLNNVYYATPLHMAARKGDPRFVKYLIKNGARLDLLDSEYRLPTDPTMPKVKCDQDVLFPPELLGKKFLRRVPPQLKTKDFKMIVLDFDRSIYPNFFKKFVKNICTKVEDPTHLILPNTLGNQLKLEDADHLPYLFSGKLLMSEDWIKKHNENRGKKLTVDYTQDIVTSVLFRDEKYDTVARIYTHIQERRIPYLARIKAYFYGSERDVWLPIATTVNLLGGVSMSHGLLPSEDDPVMNGDNNKHFNYYFKNKGPIIIFTKNPKEVKDAHAYLRNSKYITWMGTKSFIAFLLKFEIPDLQPIKNKKVVNSTEKINYPDEREWEIKPLFFEKGDDEV